MTTHREPLPREFRVIFVGTLVNRVGTFVEPFLILYLTTQRGFTPTGAGAVLAAYGIGAMASQLTGGFLADRIGRRATLAGSMFASATALGMLGFARGTWEIAAAALFVGLFGDMYRPASQALLADVVPPDRRPYAFALIFWAVNLGFAVAGITAGILAEHGYWLLFAFDAATCAGYAVIVLLGIRRDPPRIGHDPNKVATAGFRTALRDRTFMILIACWLAQAVAYFQSFLVLPLAVTDAGLSPSAYGLIAATNGLVIVTVQPFVVRWSSRQDPSRTIAVSLTITGIGFWLTTFASTLPAFIVCTVIWTRGEVGMSGHGAAIVSDLADPAARGRYLGLFGLAFGVATFVAPLVGPPIYQMLGPVWLWSMCLVLFLVAAAGNLAIRSTVITRRVEHTAATAP